MKKRKLKKYSGLGVEELRKRLKQEVRSQRTLGMLRRNTNRKEEKIEEGVAVVPGVVEGAAVAVGAAVGGEEDKLEDGSDDGHDSGTPVEDNSAYSDVDKVVRDAEDHGDAAREADGGAEDHLDRSLEGGGAEDQGEWG